MTTTVNGSPHLLLVTGCVRPVEGQAYLKLVDTEERLREYRASLRWYLEKTGFSRVIFCENSGFTLDFKDLERLAEMRGKELEVLSFVGNEAETRERGKGYGEGEIISHALANSRWAGDIAHFVKVTGRLVVENLEDLRVRLDPARLYINRLLVRNCADSLDTRLYATSTAFYEKCFAELHKEVTVQRPLEKCFMECVERGHVPFSCFPRYPEFRGTSGGDGMEYGKESRSLLFAFRAASRMGCFNHALFAHALARYRRRRG